MNINTVKTAFGLLIPKRVGTKNGKTAYTKPSLRAALIVLLADGRTLVVNATLYMPPGATIDARNPKGCFLIGNTIHTTEARHPLPDFHFVV